MNKISKIILLFLLIGLVTSCATTQNKYTKNKTKVATTVNISLATDLENGDILFIQSKEDYSPYNRFKDVMLIIGQAASLYAVIMLNK